MLALTVLIAAVSILVLILTFWRELANADRTDRRKWRRTLSFGVILLVLSIGAEAGKRVYENLREKESAERELTNQRVTSQLRDDVRSLKDEAADAFRNIETKLTSLPKATAEALSQQAREVHSAIQALPQITDRSIDDATVEKYRQAIEATRAAVRDLGAALKNAAPPPSSIGTMPPLSSPDIPSQSRSASQRDEPTLTPEASTGGRAAQSQTQAPLPGWGFTMFRSSLNLFKEERRHLTWELQYLGGIMSWNVRELVYGATPHKSLDQRCSRPVTSVRIEIEREKCLASVETGVPHPAGM